MGTENIEVKEALTALDGQVKNFIAATNEEVAKFGNLTKGQKDEMAKLSEKAEEMNARMLDLEQKQSAPSESKSVESAGQLFAKSDAYKAMQDGRTQKASLEVKNTIIGSDVTVAPDRQAGIISGASRILRVANVLPMGSTSSNAIEFTRENVFTNAAAETAENVLKPESAVTFTLETAGVKTIAHWIKLSKQVMDDAPMLASYVDNRMRYGLELRLDTALLTGTGVGAAISGLFNTGNYTVFTPGVGTNALDNIRRAITTAELADYPPTAVIMNPADVEVLDLAQGSDGHYKAADPREPIPATVWGLPIVKSNAMTAGSFLLGAFDQAAQFWNRQGVTVELFEQDDTNAQSNLVTLRAEMRGALTVYRPASLVGGGLSA